MKEHSRLFRKKIQDRYGILLMVIVCLTCFFFTSFLSQTAGNIFFGKIPALYNLTLAQLFFKGSVHPPLGKPALYSHYQLSRTYFIRGELDAALTEVQKELEVYPENVRAYYILGLTYAYMDEEEKGIEAFSRFIEAYPESWAARNDKAWLQFRVGDFAGAIKTIEPVVDIVDNPWVQNTYGTLLMNEKRYSEAKQAFLRAQRMTNMMTERSWGMSYPGNDPRIYGTGLKAMKISIASNLQLLEKY